MIAFAKHASPIPAAMWFSSTSYALVENVIKWRLNRASHIIQTLPPNYEPSKLQLSTQHPSIIDWIAFAGLRDLVIQYYNSSLKADKVFIDLMEHVVIEVADISIVLTDVEPGPGFLGVWNIFHVMTCGASNSNLQAVCTRDSLELHDSSLPGLYQMHKMNSPDTASLCQKTSLGKGFWKPVPLSTLLCSPPLARDLYHHLELYDSHKFWKFDPTFFAKYPELKWDDYEATLAKGASYRVTSSWITGS